MKPYFYPATILKYNQSDRTVNVSIAGLTDGSAEGLTALLAYPIGDDDLDTERQILPGADVWVFFENGDQHSPVVAFYRSHGKGRAVNDIRRIRQKNIEVLATSNITLQADELASIKANTIELVATKIAIKGDIEHTGNQVTSGTIKADDVMGGGKSLKSHTHRVLSKDYGVTSAPQ